MERETRKMKRSTRRLLLFFACFVYFAYFAFSTPDYSAQQQLNLIAPLGLPPDTWDYYVPKSNPVTAAKIELGRKLFFDGRLSADGNISCATCHKPELAFTDGRPVA